MTRKRLIAVTIICCWATQLNLGGRILSHAYAVPVSDFSASSVRSQVKSQHLAARSFRRDPGDTVRLSLEMAESYVERDVGESSPEDIDQLAMGLSANFPLLAAAEKIHSLSQDLQRRLYAIGQNPLLNFARLIPLEDRESVGDGVDDYIGQLHVLLHELAADMIMIDMAAQRMKSHFFSASGLSEGWSILEQCLESAHVIHASLGQGANSYEEAGFETGFVSIDLLEGMVNFAEQQFRRLAGTASDLRSNWNNRPTARSQSTKTGRMEGVETEEEIGKQLTEIQNRIERMHRRVRSFNLSRGRFDTLGTLAILDVNTQIRSFLGKPHVIVVKGFQTEIDMDDALPPVSIDPDLLFYVLRNLVTNAAEAAHPANPGLSIQTRRDGGWVRVDVLDQGPGISQDFLPQMFERGETTKAHELGQHGIGLSLVLDIIDAAEGTIEVVSRQKDEGTYRAYREGGVFRVEEADPKLVSDSSGTRFIIRLPAVWTREQWKAYVVAFQRVRHELTSMLNAVIDDLSETAGMNIFFSSYDHDGKIKSHFDQLVSKARAWGRKYVRAGLSLEKDQDHIPIRGDDPFYVEAMDLEVRLLDLIRLIERISSGDQRDIEKVVQFMFWMRMSHHLIRSFNMSYGLFDTLGDPEPLDIRQSISKFVDWETEMMDKHYLDMWFEAAEELPAIFMDPHLLFHIWMNLFINADEAALGDKTTIHIKAWREDQTVRVDFLDRGEGINREQLGRIFTPGYTTKADRGGSGIGLDLVYEIVTRAGGSITVVSRAEPRGLVHRVKRKRGSWKVSDVPKSEMPGGTGTRFSIRFPIIQAGSRHPESLPRVSDVGPASDAGDGIVQTIERQVQSVGQQGDGVEFSIPASKPMYGLEERPSLSLFQLLSAAGQRQLRFLMTDQAYFSLRGDGISSDILTGLGRFIDRHSQGDLDLSKFVPVVVVAPDEKTASQIAADGMVSDVIVHMPLSGGTLDLAALDNDLGNNRTLQKNGLPTRIRDFTDLVLSSDIRIDGDRTHFPGSIFLTILDVFSGQAHSPHADRVTNGQRIFNLRELMELLRAA